MQKTEINWTEHTWGTASGCTKVSAGCKHCYAQLIAEQKRGTRAFPNGFDLTLRPHKMGEPRRLKEPSLIFTNSMTDLFLEEIPDSFRDEQCAVMAEVDRHRYQVLTKRPEVAARYFSTRTVPSSVWLGVTVEHAKTEHRIDTLRGIDARVRFLSIEPLLGPLDLRGKLDGIHWVIVGGESGAHLMDPKECEVRGLVRRGGRGEPAWVAREDRTPWVRAIRDACEEQGVAFWFKQWGGSRGPLAGRLLDGRTHDGMPTVPGCMPAAYVHESRNSLGRRGQLQLEPPRSNTTAV
jgi:protein gp37